MQVGGPNDIISWKHYVSIKLQHVKPIHRLHMPAGMRVTILTPGSNLLNMVTQSEMSTKTDLLSIKLLEYIVDP